jgi:cholest-4-en-3-one 26-monooxygenase
MSDAVMASAKATIFDPDTYSNGDPDTFGLPLDAYGYLRDNEPCFLQTFDNPFLRERVWVLTRHADVLAVDRDPTTWTFVGGPFLFKVPFLDPEHPLGKPSMLTSDGADHTRQRGVIRRGFNPTRVRELEDRFRVQARAVVDGALEAGTFNFVRQVAGRMPIEALGDVLGVPREDRERFFDWVDKLCSPFDPRVVTLEEALNANQGLMDYAVELAAKRSGDLGDDVVSHIIAAAGDDKLTTDELLGNVGVLASGAAESTRSALSHGMHELMRRPDQMAWLRDRADDIPATAINELVRIATPFMSFVRVATKDVELHGQLIAAGEYVLIQVAAANFDPRAFENPTDFDLARDPNPHLSFGRGPHSCLGKHVAALEMKILLEELLQRTREITPAGPISYGRDFMGRPVFDLPVSVEAA